MKGILTDCRTGEKKKIEIDYKIVNDKHGKIFRLIGGPTGYESFYINSDRLERICDNGWTACVGTRGVYDKLFIPGEEMRKAIDVILAAQDQVEQ